MTNQTQIQTVHGITHPIVVQVAESQPAERDDPPATQHYREAFEQRLEQNQQEPNANRASNER